MKNHISNEIVDYVGILAKLELSENEKNQAKEDMEKMLGYIDILNEVDTTGITDIKYLDSRDNIFREDEIKDAGIKEEILENAPNIRDDMFCVPKTI